MTRPKRPKTLEELLDQYLYEKPLSQASQDSYTRILNILQQDTGIRTIGDVTTPKLLKWRENVRSRTTDITWNTYLRHMRALWSFAIEKGYTRRRKDPFRELNWGKRKKTLKKTITQEQLKTVIAALSDPDCPLEPCWFWKYLVRFVYYTGIRRRQLTEIRWKDLDLETQTLHLSADGEKTGRARKIPLHQNLVQDLLEYRDLMSERYPAFHKPEGQLFNVTLFYDRYRGPEMTVDQVSGFFRRLSDHLGFHVSAHMLRHTMATEIGKTGKIKELQQILGHANIHTTMSFYLHPDMKQLRDSLDELDDI